MKKAILRLAIALVLLLPTSFVIANESVLDPGYTIIETALAPTQGSPFTNLDLIPQPASDSSSSDFIKMNLYPRSVTLNSSRDYFNPAIRVSTAGDTLFTVSALSLVALNIADYFSTKEALTHPGLSEGNPLMKPFTKNPVVFAAVKAGISVFSYWSMKGLYKKSKPLAWVVSLATNFAMSYVVSNNIRLINQVKGR